MRIAVTMGRQAEKLEQLIQNLESGASPDRQVDVSIALMAGYTRVVHEDTERSKNRVSWLDPNQQPVIGVPFFTSSLEDAYKLVMFVEPHAPCACSWGPGTGKATIDGYPTCVASSPAIALCIAALAAKRRTI